jgi:hypothetical protein
VQFYRQRNGDANVYTTDHISPAKDYDCGRHDCGRHHNSRCHYRCKDNDPGGNFYRRHHNNHPGNDENHPCDTITDSYTITNTDPHNACRTGGLDADIYRFHGRAADPEDPWLQ